MSRMQDKMFNCEKELMLYVIAVNGKCYFFAFRKRGTKAIW